MDVFAFILLCAAIVAVTRISAAPAKAKANINTPPPKGEALPMLTTDLPPALEAELVVAEVEIPPPPSAALVTGFNPVTTSSGFRWLRPALRLEEPALPAWQGRVARLSNLDRILFWMRAPVGFGPSGRVWLARKTLASPPQAVRMSKANLRGVQFLRRSLHPTVTPLH